MASTSEVGHAKNVANLADLTSFITTFGAAYSPSKTSLKLAELQTLHSKASDNLSAVILKRNDFNVAVDQRVNGFANLRALSTRLVNALKVTDATAETISNAQGFNRKIQGQRATPKIEITDASQPAPKTISSSQQSVDQLIQHFEALITVLDNEASYNPNEQELKVASLKTLLSELKAKNQTVSDAYAEVSSSRAARNKTLYTHDTGLVDTAIDAKNYIKSAFGATSTEYNQVKPILFKNQKIG